MHLLARLSLTLLIITPLTLISTSSKPTLSLRDIRAQLGAPGQRLRPMNAVATNQPQPEQDEEHKQSVPRHHDQISSSSPSQPHRSYAIGELPNNPQPAAQASPDEPEQKEQVELKSNESAANTESMVISSIFAAIEKNDFPAAMRLIGDGQVDINEREAARHELNNYTAGFTPLMKAAARGTTEIAALLLEKGADVLASKMVVARELLAMHRGHGQIKWPANETTREAIRIIILNHMHYGALKLAAIAGHEDIVDLLLEALANIEEGLGGIGISRMDIALETLFHTIDSLIFWSHVLETDAGDALFKQLEITTKPLLHQYQSLLKKLAHDLPWQTYYRAGSWHNLFDHFMIYGPLEIAETCAESFANVQVTTCRREWRDNDNKINHYYTPSSEPWSDKDFEELLRKADSGEKLAALLAIQADPESGLYKFSRGFLAYLEKNPRANPTFVQRIKNYIQLQQALTPRRNSLLQPYLPIPDVAAIALAYVVGRLPSADLIQRILAIDLPAIDRIEQKARAEADERNVTEQRIALMERKDQQ